MTQEGPPIGEIRRGHPRILFVTSSLDLGGTERHLSLIAPALLKRGCAVSVYNISGVSNALVQKPMVDAGVEIISPSLSGLNNYQNKRPWLALVERRLHGAMTAIIGNSQSVLDQLRDEERVPRDKLVLIYNGIDLEPFDRPLVRASKRKQLGLSEDTLVLAIVANLISYKGHADLFTALGSIKSKLPTGWALLVIGRDDNIGDQLKKQAQTLGIADHVHFLGERLDVVELLRISDVGLLCSHEEGFSNALLEGMAAGLPMIATNVGGNAEAIVDGVTGFLVPARAPEAMGQAILRFARDPALARQMGLAGPARVEHNFSLEACVNSYEAFYRRVMGADAPFNTGPRGGC